MARIVRVVFSQEMGLAFIAGILLGGVYLGVSDLSNPMKHVQIVPSFAIATSR